MALVSSCGMSGVEIVVFTMHWYLFSFFVKYIAKESPGILNRHCFFITGTSEEPVNKTKVV